MTRRVTLSVKMLCVGAVVAVLASACTSAPSTSSSTTAGGGGGSSAGATARGVTAKEITIGGVASLSGPSGAPFPGVDIGAEARFARANREGGVNGRKINFLGTTDDGSSATTAMSAVQKLVLSDNVFAVAPVVSIGFSAAVSDFLKSNNTPFVGYGFSAGFCDTSNEWGFGFNGCLNGTTAANTSLLAPLHKSLPNAKTIALQCNNTLTNPLACKQEAFVAPLVGLKVTYNQSNIPSTGTVTDYTPYVQAIMTSNNGQPPDIVVLNAPATVIGLSQALKSAGFKGALANYVEYVPGLLTSSPQTAAALDGGYVITQVAPQEQGGAAIKQIQKDLKAINQPTTISNGIEQGYWSADMLLAQLKAAGPKLTPDTFNKKVNNDWTYTPSPADGIGPISYPVGRTEASPCSAMVQIQGTNYKLSQPMTCGKNVPYDTSTTTTAAGGS